MVICYGTSPNAAADWAIKEGLVESERAESVAIPPHLEARFYLHANILLSQEDVDKHFSDIPLIIKEKS